MLPELGHAALILALMTSLLCVFLPLLSRITHTALHPLASPLAVVQFLLISTAFAILINAYAMSDFSVVNVVLNSHSLKPMLYKITGTWGNHEGSMMLWVWVLSLYAVALAFHRPKDADLQQRTLIIQSAICAGFLLFILFTSNPFLRMYPPAAEGNDLNPLLQDIGLAMHPPLLYTGYVGFSIVFAYAIAGLWQKRIDADWAKATQPWVLAAWTALTLGIGLGSWWAYRELGWGGWWFWDPVENVSLLPWLVGTALLHSNLVLIRRGNFAKWVALLAILCFAMSLIGTFIVRSGLIMSVHSFTSDPMRGYAILGYIVVAVGAALTFYARTPLAAGTPTPLASREGSILVNNLLLLTLAFTILLAILTPLFLTLMNKPSITVGAPYFNGIFFPLAAPILFIAGLSPLLPWGQWNRTLFWKAFSPLLMFAGAGALVGFVIFNSHILFGMLGGAFTAWLFSATVTHALRRMRALPAIEHETVLQRLRRFPMAHMATFFGHLGLAVLCAAITLSSLLKERYEAPIPKNGVVQFGNYTLTLTKAEKRRAFTYETRKATFDVTYAGKKIATLTPEIRHYDVRGMETSEVALISNPWRDIYLVIGQATGSDSSIGVRLYVTPGMMILWIGFGLMALGGGIGCVAYLRKGSA